VDMDKQAFSFETGYFWPI